MDKALQSQGTEVYADDGPSGEAVVGEKDGSLDDVKDMQRMGKEQQFRRNFGFLSIMGFAMILMSTWESQLGTAGFALGNGGTAGLIYMYIACAIGMSLNIASMAEMASMAPTAGGQYHWVSEFAPPRAQKFVSYFIGWVCVLGWQAGSASSVFLAGTEIQGLLVLNYDNYVYKYWHGTLLTIAITLVCGFFNTILAKRLPLVEGLVLFLHVAGFFGILVPLWVLAPRTPSKQVWTVFEDANGWGNVGLPCLVGMNSPVLSLLGADAATHMSEELKNAGKLLPRAMLFTAVFNGTLGFIMVITFCYTVGNVEEALSTPTGYPFIQVFYNATQSKAGATAMVSIMIALSTFGAMTNMATGSRQIFAFARDRGVPFSGWFSHVPAGWDIPLNAVLFTITVSCLLSIINIGSQIAFNQLTSLGLCALLSSYITSISCMALRRIRKQPLLPSKFSLGRWGLPINLLSIGFLFLAFTMIFFPPGPNPEPAAMNWAILVYGGVVIFSLTYYVFRGRFRYAGPVEYVRKMV